MRRRRVPWRSAAGVHWKPRDVRSSLTATLALSSPNRDHEKLCIIRVERLEHVLVVHIHLPEPRLRLSSPVEDEALSIVAHLPHGGQRKRLALDDVDVEAPDVPEPNYDILAVHEVLNRLEQVDSRSGEIVKLRYFAGLTIPEIAAVLGISPSTVDRQWAYARAWLHAELKSHANVV